MMNSDDQMMSRCLELAALAKKSGDSQVGSVVVRRWEIIGAGVESVRLANDPTAHAEIVAIRMACEKSGTLDLSDCELFTNVEPCVMCLYAIKKTRIGRVVF
ncbi:MAG: nucleoside deaminase [Pyrinomonadaceae bacterium]